MRLQSNLVTALAASSSQEPPTIGSRPMRCAEVMKQTVHTVREDDTILTAAQRMREEDVGFLPVRRGGDENESSKNNNELIVGILTDRDIVTRACSQGVDLSSTKVAAVMTRALVSCRPEDPIAHVEALMRDHRITRIVITNPEGALVGVVSLSDLAPYESAARIGRTLQSIAERKYGPERP